MDKSGDSLRTISNLSFINIARSMQKAFVYRSREGRAHFLASLILKTTSLTCLNVGSGGASALKLKLKVLQQQLVTCIDVDKVGDVDIRQDIDLQPYFAYDDQEFDIIVCSDCLEHLENFHAVFFELMRLSRKYVVITLPVPSIEIRSTLFGAPFRSPQFGFYSKYYGLPVEKPVDRHRWWFSLSDVIRFCEANIDGDSFDYAIIEPPIKSSLKLLFKFLLPKRIFQSLFVPYVMIVMERKD